MKILLACLLTILTFNCMSNHVLGGHIEFECAGDGYYDVHLVLYTDCFGAVDASDTENLFFIPEAGCLAFSALATLQSEEEISDVCPELLEATSCNGGFQPGALKLVYSVGVDTDDAFLDPECTWHISWSAGDWNYFQNVDTSDLPSAHIRSTIFQGAECVNASIASETPVPFSCSGSLVDYPVEIQTDAMGVSFTLEPLLTGIGDPVDYNLPFAEDSPIFNSSFNPVAGILSGIAPPLPGTYGASIGIHLVDEEDNPVAFIQLSFAIISNPCAAGIVYFDDPPIESAVSDLEVVGGDTILVETGDMLCFSVGVNSNLQSDVIEVYTDALDFFPGADVTITGENPVSIGVCQDGIDPDFESAVITYNASNGDCLATEDQVQITILRQLIPGCTWPGACNYDPEAEIDDDSCWGDAGFCEGEMDCDNDGLLSNTDLLCFLSNFGCTGADCTGDFNGDGITNVLDLLIFMQYWPGIFPP